LDRFEWEPQPEAAALVGSLVDSFVDANRDISLLATLMRERTGTRVVDWVDYLALEDRPGRFQSLIAAGFDMRLSGQPTLVHRGGLFPEILCLENGTARIVIKVDSVDKFLAANDWAGAYVAAACGEASQPRDVIVGRAGDPLRTCCVSHVGETELWIVERHGSRGTKPVRATNEELAAAKVALNAFQSRKRDFESPQDGFADTAKLFEEASSGLSRDWACDLFFIAEREYWQSRNQAAQAQKRRQDELGLGWANHDHHTYRSSRACFIHLIRTLEAMGFQCRERFYAGSEAGWGAQVLEQPNCGVVIFADVDLSPEEVAGDFAHEQLPPRDNMGTVGLWCELHGEAFLEAGMHHLECQFDFDAAREQLASEGVESMAPFTNFSYLKQAFTQGEIWPVRPERIDAALAAGWITADQAQKFRREGALGSHLETLERNEGYKGFNQTGISEIIQRTDPRGTFGA
jgi:hypothetical protein